MTAPRHVHHARERRWVTLASIVVVIAAVAVASRSPGSSAPGGPPVSSTALVSPPKVESSAWYCVGPSTVSGGVAQGSIVLTNTGPAAVSALLTAVTDTGSKVSTTATVPPRSQIVAPVPAPSSGKWMATSVVLSGGGVAVSQSVHGLSGWSEAPCVSTTSQDWYYPSGTTSGSADLYTELLNPSSSPVVVDVSFVTPAGVVHPINFQGLVLQPDQLQVQDVSAYVQNQAHVSTTVSARTGRIVAAELQVIPGPPAGLALVTGAPVPSSTWAIPEALELSGGSTSIDVYNPGSTTESVTVRAALGSGPVSPFHMRLLPESSWQLVTSSQTRIPSGDTYAATVQADGGPGVVVGRPVTAPSGASQPQFGLAMGVDALSASAPSDEWVVPSPGTSASPAVSGVLPAHLGLSDTGRRAVHYAVDVLLPAGDHMIASGTVGPGHFVSLGDSVLFPAGLNPLVVRTSGPVALSEDVGPAGTLGVITMPGIPLAVADS